MFRLFFSKNICNGTSITNTWQNILRVWLLFGNSFKNGTFLKGNWEVLLGINYAAIYQRPRKLLGRNINFIPP